MEIIQLQNGLGECVLRASGVLRKGGVIVYPTDTLYGLGADAFSDESVEKIYAIKGRDPQKPIHAVFADLAMVEEYAIVNDAARKLAAEFLPGPLTMVLQKKPGITGGIGNVETIGVRIPDNDFCLELAKTYGKPFTTTSANKAGVDPESEIQKIMNQLGGSVDLVIDGGVLPMSAPSTVVNLLSGVPVILREGAIPSAQILK